MAALPEGFRTAYDQKGESFFQTAALLCGNHGRQYTQADIAEEVGVSKTRISDFTQELVADGWLDRHDGQTSFVWNTEKHNPAEYEATAAVDSVATEALALAVRAWRSPAESLALVAILGVITGAVLVAGGVVALFLSVGSVTPQAYALIGGGFALGSLLALALVDVAARLSRRRG